MTTIIVIIVWAAWALAIGFCGGIGWEYGSEQGRRAITAVPKWRQSLKKRIHGMKVPQMAQLHRRKVQEPAPATT